MDTGNNICVGIDFGCHSIYITVTSCEIPDTVFSSMQTVMNCFQKERRILPMMGIYKKQVMPCDKAYFSYVRNPRAFVPYIKQYLKKDPSYEKNKYDFSICSEVHTNEKGEFSFVITTEGNQCTVLSSDIVLVSILTELKSLIHKANSNYDGENTTISIPIYWTKEQLQVLYRALEIAEYKNVNFMYDIEAIALQYGYYPSSHHQLSDCRVMFLDIGYLHASVFEVEYKRDQPFKILYCGNSTKVGGKIVDQILIEYVLQILKKDYDIDEQLIFNSPRDKAAIQSACEKAKTYFCTEGTHSTNISFSLQCDDEQDISIDILYDTFLSLCSKHSIFETITSLCENCLTQCEGADYIILEGSSSRFYEVTRLLNQLIPSLSLKTTPRIKFTSNIEEDVSRGCCVYSCMKTCRIPWIKVDLPEQLATLNTTVVNMIDTKDCKEDASYERIRLQLKRINEPSVEAEEIHRTRDEIDLCLQKCSELLERKDENSGFVIPYYMKAEIKDYLSIIRNSVSISKGNDYKPEKYAYLLSKVKAIETLIEDMFTKKRCVLGLIDI